MTSGVAEHYAASGLIAAIRTGVEKLGKSTNTVTIDDLAPADEFHIGGRVASGALFDPLGFSGAMRILDVGCGLGGPARFVANRYGSRVTGIDLTAAYVEAGTELSRWVGLDDKVTLMQGSALSMPFTDGEFDAAYMLHVGMNIADKAALAREVSRVLRPGAVFAVYDVMQTGLGDLTFPVPWATTADQSAVATPERYRAALQDAGFKILGERNRRDFAVQFFADQRALLAAAGGPPPLGLHLLMGTTRAEKIANMAANISAGRIAPVEMIGRR